MSFERCRVEEQVDMNCLPNTVNEILSRAEDGGAMNEAR
jgi:hypothetical protein